MQVKYEMVRRVRVDGVSIARSAAAFGFSRPSFYQAAVAVDAHGLAGLVPACPGPKRAHKLTDETVAFARRAREDEPVLPSTDLVELIADRFGITVHPRSVERALARGRERSASRPDLVESAPALRPRDRRQDAGA
jgi:transposase